MTYEITANTFPLTRPKILVSKKLSDCEHSLLYVSMYGFLLAYYIEPYESHITQFNNIHVRLRTFDAEEWGRNIAQFHSEEVSLTNDRFMQDATIFTDELPEENACYVNSVLMKIAQGNLLLYNRLHSSQAYRVQRRVQAIEAVPLLRMILPNMDEKSFGIRDCIDRGENLWDAILACSPGRLATLKRLSKDNYIIDNWNASLSDLQVLLDPLPLEKFPVTEAEWNSFIQICRGLRIQTETDTLRKEYKHHWLVQFSKTGWVKVDNKYSAYPQGVAALGDAFDFLDELARAGNWLVNNVKQCRRSDNLSHQELTQIHWKRAPEAMGIQRIVEASLIWHNQMHGFANLLDPLSSIRWEPLFKDPVQLSDNVQAVVLANSLELSKEGRALHHCVATYENGCFSGRRHIVSMRNNDGESLSTLEIIQNGSNDWFIVQHRARNNSYPALELTELEPLLINHIKKKADLAKLEQWKKSVELGSLKSRKGNNNLAQPFSYNRLLLLSQVLGSERLLGLFVDPAVVRQSRAVTKKARDAVELQG
jgi:hypothetical protein